MKAPILILFLFFCCIAATRLCHAQASFFDPSFGTSGKTIIPLGTTEDGRFQGITIQPDGKIVAAGFMIGKAVVARFKENGTPDSSFAINGFYTGPVYGSLYDVAIQPDGKIVAGGELNNSFFALRLHPNGTPDISFGMGGTATIGFGAFINSHGRAIALQPDGKVVMSGECSSANMGIARLHANGTPDLSFGTSGVVIGPYGRANGVCVASDGKIVAGGHATASMGYALMAVRYLTDGTLDPSFNHTGIVYTAAGDPGGNFGREIGLQPDGKILLAGSGGFGSEAGNFVVVRYNTDGSLDGSFGSSGIAAVDFSGEDDNCRDMYVLADGRMLLTGSSGPYENPKFAVARLKSNGSIDNTFGVNGRIVNLVGVKADYALAIALQATGKVVVAGSSVKTMTATYEDPIVVRYLTGEAGVPDMAELNYATMLYPNPVRHLLHISPDMAGQFPYIFIYDAAGREVLASDIKQDGSVDVAHLENGWYLCKMIRVTDGMAVFKQVIIKN